MKNNVYLESKPRYEILDGLRGVAALMVVAFHLFETYNARIGTQIINHGYLAVDFFFVLSGFVIGYAYYDRWGEGKMTTWGFFKRRLTRLHPMLIAGTVIGVLLFYFGDCGMFGLVGQTTWYRLLLMALIGCLMIPVKAGMDVRGWAETYPLNGPQWSLMLEYIANIVYAFILRRLPKAALIILCAIAGFFTIDLGLGLNVLGDLPSITLPDGTVKTMYHGNFIGGWGIEGWQFHVALVRLSFPFLMGYLLSKATRHIKVKGGFWWCSLLIVFVLSLPQFGGRENPIYNGIYETVIIMALFPVIVSMGAGSAIKGAKSQKICKFLGEISYPIYITHYPLMYMQMAWAEKHVDTPVSTHVMVSVCLYILSVGMAYALFKLYDEPVRKWLTEHWLKRKTA